MGYAEPNTVFSHPIHDTDASVGYNFSVFGYWTSANASSVGFVHRDFYVIKGNQGASGSTYSGST